MKLLAGSALLGELSNWAPRSGFAGHSRYGCCGHFTSAQGIAYFATNLSPALFGVGYIVGLNVGIVGSWPAESSPWNIKRDAGSTPRTFPGRHVRARGQGRR